MSFCFLNIQFLRFKLQFLDQGDAMMRSILSAIVIVLTGAATLVAHDTWVQTNSNLVRMGDAVHVDLMLGNHGNDHRDFKLASKVDPAGCTLAVVSPSGKTYDIKDRLADLGYAPKEGFWSTRFKAGEAGLHTVAHTRDGVVNHGQPTRSIKSGKTHFLASASLDKPPMDTAGFAKPLGHPFELVLQSHPVTPMGPGQAIRVRLLFKGKPMPEALVSFIPRGVSLASEFDEKYERKTDAEGLARFTPTEGNYYLIVAHHVAPEETGKDYERTQYSATLTLLVPELCPCCGE
jgi:uncharacterized GH25 family protein